MNSAALTVWAVIFALTALAGMILVAVVRLLGVTMGNEGVMITGSVVVSVLGVSAISTFAGWLWLVVLSHRDDELLQTLLIPFYALYYGFRTWKQSSFPTSLCCGGMLPVVLLLAMMISGSIMNSFSRPSRSGASLEPLAESTAPASVVSSRISTPAPDPSSPSSPSSQSAIVPPALPSGPPSTVVLPQGLMSDSFPLGKGYRIRRPNGFIEKMADQGRFEWIGPADESGVLPSLAISIGVSGTGKVSYTTGKVTANLDEPLIKVDGIYELRDSEVSRRQVGNISFVRASRERSSASGQQHILAYLANHNGQLLEALAIDGPARRWLATMEQSIESITLDSEAAKNAAPGGGGPIDPSAVAAAAPHVTALPGLSQAAGGDFRVFDAVVANGGRRCVYVDQATRRFHVWDLIADKEIHQWDPYPNTTNLLKMAISADGKFFVVHGRSDDPGVDAWDPETGKRLCHIGNFQITPGAICVSQDGRLIAADQQQQGIGVWNVADGREICRLPTEGWSSILTISPDGRRLAAHYPPTYIDAWEIPSGKKLMHSQSQASGLAVMNFSPQGDRLVAAGGGYGGVIVPVPSKESSPPGTKLRAIYGAAFLKDGAEVLLATTEMAEITSCATGKMVRQVPVGSTQMRPLTAYFSPDGRTALLCSSASRGIQGSWVWRLPD